MIVVGPPGWHAVYAVVNPIAGHAKQPSYVAVFSPVVMWQERVFQGESKVIALVVDDERALGELVPASTLHSDDRCRFLGLAVPGDNERAWQERAMDAFK